MSESMAEKKKKEDAERAAEEERVVKEMANDRCPYCGKFTSTFDYAIMLPAPWGWLECPGCGIVFCPDSIRRQKLAKMNQQEQESLIQKG